MKGMVIAGTHSGCGKTTVTLGILAALKKKGLAVQSFKAGPDFIDAGLHRMITGRTSRNLDLWMCGEDYARECFRRHSADVDISVVEGVMGLYDGKFSTSVLAATLGLPVILVVDAYGMAESAGAVVKGFIGYNAEASRLHPDFRTSELQNFKTVFAGVVFNRVASENHYRRLKESVRDVPVLGYLPRDPYFEIPHRHLGLRTAEEMPLLAEGIDKLADTVLRHIKVEKIAGKRGGGEGRKSVRAKAQKANNPHLFPLNLRGERGVTELLIPNSKLRIAVAYDRAFCFYYQDNLDLLRDAGAEIIPFSPLADEGIPDGADALYLGGGYPELYVKELSGNRSLLESVRNMVNTGMPVYGECGGFMYLTEGIYDFQGVFYPMVGAFPLKTRMTDKRAKLGYRALTLKQDCIIGKKGTACRGHEFHYSETMKSAEARKCGSTKENGGLAYELAYDLRDGNGKDLPGEGYRVKNTLGSYVHVHFGSNKDIAGSFISFSTNAKLMKT